MEPGTGQIDDLASLNELDEGILLEEVRIRYSRDIIYTYIGDILVAINPFKDLPIYTNEVARRYSDIKIRNQLPPHIFAIADKAYQSMKRTGVSQCCVVSGESGAGKTESTKLMVKHIIQLCRCGHSDIHQRIVEVNPLLEAFGNAQTVMNNNSSRFGKFIELIFATDGKIIGAKINDYLLEKSRVVGASVGEKNFHIFYYMFAGLQQEQLKNYLLDKPHKHRILRPKNNKPIYLNDAVLKYNKDMLNHLKLIMNVVGFQQEEVESLFALLAAVLHIGDIQFEKDLDTDGVYVQNEFTLDIVAQLLGVNSLELASVLISNVSILRGERIVSFKNLSQANDGRDALAKALYARLFGWIVRQINWMLQPSEEDSASRGPEIGILDIAGFENFEMNSFEQLCINVANEQLQYYFNQHIFAWEMDEYKREGITESSVSFTNNRPLIDLFLDKPLGIFSLLDEESKFPRGSDSTLVEKFVKHHGKNNHFLSPRGQDIGFGIVHYAGTVVYNAVGFLEKNRDTLSINLIECMKNSESQFVCDLFSSQMTDTGSLLMSKNLPKRSRKSILLCKPPDMSKWTESLSKKAGKKLLAKQKQSQIQAHEEALKNQKTAGAKFQNSLTDLMTKLLEAEPQFVRCIKPNHYKRANNFNPPLVLQQLRYTGVLETTRIRRIGFPTRLPLSTFLDRYKLIAFSWMSRVEPTPLNCYKILQIANIHGWEMGKNKIFLKYWHTEQLNLAMDKYYVHIQTVQRFVRGFLARKQVAVLRERMLKEKSLVRVFTSMLGQRSNQVCDIMKGQKEHDAVRHEKLLEEKRRVAEEAKKKQNEENMYQRQLPPPPVSPPPPPPHGGGGPGPYDQYNNGDFHYRGQGYDDRSPERFQERVGSPLYRDDMRSPYDERGGPPGRSPYNDGSGPSGPGYHRDGRDGGRDNRDIPGPSGYRDYPGEYSASPPSIHPMDYPRDYPYSPEGNRDFRNAYPNDYTDQQRQYNEDRGRPRDNERGDRLGALRERVASPPRQGMPDVVGGQRRPYQYESFKPPPMPTPGVRRTKLSDVIDSRYEYRSMKSSVAAPSDFAAMSEMGHYARRPNAQKKLDRDKLYKHLISDAMAKRSGLDPDIWCKIIYMEKEQGIAKFYVREEELTIDGSFIEYDGIRLGLGKFSNPFRDEKTEKVREHIGKGFVLRRDDIGNIWASRLGKNDVIVKGYADPAHNSVSADVIKHMGRLPYEQPIKIFDMKEFKSHMAIEMSKRKPHMEILQPRSIVALSFVKNTIDDMDTPCWIILINFLALNALQDQRVLKEVELSIEELVIERTTPQGVEAKRNQMAANRQWSKQNLRQGLEGKEPPARKKRIENRKGHDDVQQGNYSWNEDSPNATRANVLARDSVLDDEDEYDFQFRGPGEMEKPVRKKWAKLKIMEREQSTEDGS